MTAPPRCKVCISNLLPDGTCRYKCPPELKRSAVTAKVTAAKRRAEAARIDSERVHLTRDEEARVTAKLLQRDPLYALGHSIAAKAGRAAALKRVSGAAGRIRAATGKRDTKGRYAK